MRISDMFPCLFVQVTRENSDRNSNYRGVSTIRYTYPTRKQLARDLFLWFTFSLTIMALITQAIALAENSLCLAIARLLQLVACWPVTACGCERSISALRRLKTYLRSTMTETRLPGLALLHVYGYNRGDIDKAKVVHKFFHQCPTRLIVPAL